MTDDDARIVLRYKFEERGYFRKLQINLSNNWVIIRPCVSQPGDLKISGSKHEIKDGDVWTIQKTTHSLVLKVNDETMLTSTFAALDQIMSHGIGTSCLGIWSGQLKSVEFDDIDTVSVQYNISNPESGTLPYNIVGCLLYIVQWIVHCPHQKTC